MDIFKNIVLGQKKNQAVKRYVNYDTIYLVTSNQREGGRRIRLRRFGRGLPPYL